MLENVILKLIRSDFNYYNKDKISQCCEDEYQNVGKKKQLITFTALHITVPPALHVSIIIDSSGTPGSSCGVKEGAVGEGLALVVEGEDTGLEQVCDTLITLLHFTK